MESLDAESDSETSSIPWGWLAGTAIAAIGFVVVAGAVLLTPGDPFSCRLPNVGGWLLCEWTRRFVANATLLVVVVFAVTVVLAIPVAVLRAVRAGRS